MNLFLVNNDSTIDKIIQLSEYVEGRDFILCFNYLVYLRLKKERRGHQFKFIEEVLTAQDYQVLHSKTDQFAFDWYSNDGIDRTLFKGISFGKLVQIMFSRRYYLSIKIKFAEATRKVFNELRDVNTIFYDFSSPDDCIFGILNMPEVIKKIARSLGAEVKQIKPNAVIPDLTLVRPHLHNNNVKKNIFMNLIVPFKYLINGISRLRSLGQSEGKIYLFDFANIENLINYCPERLVITNLNKRLIKWRVFFSGLKFLQFEDIKYRLNKEETEFLRLLEKEFLSKDGNIKFGCDFTINDIDYSEFYKSAIQEIVSKIIPDLLKYVGQVKIGLRQVNIKTILVSESLTEKGRSVVEVCKQKKVRTIFVDHGIIGHSQAQMVADQSSTDEALTTTVFYNPYKFQSKLIDLGNPCMDPYPANKRKKVTSIKKVLFLNFEDNPYARLDRFSYQEEFYKEVFTSFEELLSAGIKIYFRPHLLDNDYYEYLFKFFSVDSAKIQYAFSGSFTERIQEMDLLVTNISTCFFEAQAAGVPAIFMEPHFNEKAVVAPFNGANEEEVLRVSTKEELVRVILSNQKDPKYLNDFLDKFLNKYAPLYMGPLDGLVSKRIMEYVCN